jgi:hypothetical protein
MVANPAHEIYRASAGAVGCATHRFVKSPDDLDAFGADVSGDSSGDIRVIRIPNDCAQIGWRRTGPYLRL